MRGKPTDGPAPASNLAQPIDELAAALTERQTRPETLKLRSKGEPTLTGAVNLNSSPEVNRNSEAANLASWLNLGKT